MKPIVKYIEHKPSEHTDAAPAWIAHVWPSSSGKTLYFNDMALKLSSGRDSNHFDLVTGEDYWVTGVKKKGSNRHWGRGAPIHIEQSLVDWYHGYAEQDHSVKLIVVPDMPQPDFAKFHAIENETTT